MIRFLRLIFVLLVLAGSASVIVVPLFGIWQFKLATILAIGMTVVCVLSPQVASLLFGLSLCVFPMFGGGVLSLAVCGYILGAEIRIFLDDAPDAVTSSERMVRVAVLTLLLGFLGSSITPFLVELDIPLFRSIVTAGGLSSLYDYLLVDVRQLTEVPRFLAGYFIVLLLIFSFGGLQKVYGIASSFLHGLLLGSVVSVAVLLGQYKELSPYLSITRASFWVYTGRYSGSFSDPNAFGLMSVLLIPVLCLCFRGWSNVLGWVVALLLGAATLWSGSRTFIVGILIWGLLLAFRWAMNSEGPARKIVLGTLVGCGVLFLAFVSSPKGNELALQASLPIGIERVIETIRIDKTTDRFESRKIFGKIALEIWQQQSWAGIGLGNFYKYQDEAAQRLGIDLGEWRDNANNFYLQILAEGGLIQILILIFAFYFFAKALSPVVSFVPTAGFGLRVQSLHRLRWVARTEFGVFAVLLLFGPHTSFDEIRYLLTAILVLGVCYAEISSQRAAGFYRKMLLLGTLVVPLAYSALFADHYKGVLQRGFYKLEESERGPVRWSSATSYFSFCGSLDGPRVLNISAPRPNLEKEPIQVSISRWSGDHYELINELQLRDTSWRTIVIPSTSDAGIRHERYLLRINPLWRPESSAPEGSDVRWLGVMMQWTEDLCNVE